LNKAKAFSTKLRPGTAGSHESAQGLLLSESETFRTYRDSINSIQDIAERVGAVTIIIRPSTHSNRQDDAQSLVSVHQLLSMTPEDDDLSASHRKEEDPIRSSAQTSKSERRRSLPVTRKDSLSSLRSDYGLASPPPEVASFQMRRRRVAKLVDFFGVDYRVLFDSVLSTIELGVEEEASRGTLRPDETEVMSVFFKVIALNAC
jgi:hypothetical protein